MKKENEIISNEESSNPEEIMPKQEVIDETSVSEEIQNPLELLKEELSVANDKYLRLYSDFENYKRRLAKERIELIKTAGADVITSLLPIIDDFERAMKAQENTSDVTALKEGIQLIFQKLNNTLTQQGLTAIESINKPFDTDLHEAITSIPADDDKKGLVVDEIEKGYMLNDKVVRHAKVVVGS
ncbi:MAG TPA: nucleotide exchange factor GrpE [Bacteroidia bacterium]|nr:nucleotide exchange factor GrpE [Bacteroidia bacterium]HQW17379.1 nucleotide exchange factor GrpE [Bacteroidia bacterium]HQW48589.1 nucleotide exchange factor GrpE [Bacteroidia bacterium]HQX68975.1 nucleotide exchange factor GrpE [Bacteroidia bacterium]HQZ78210.1 nucleotide exchange factor GrpE [Bacteroidia bacterium]